MIDLVSEMASAHARFRTGAQGVRVPGRPRVWRAPYLAPADIERSRYWTLEREPLPVPSGRSLVPGEGERFTWSDVRRKKKLRPPVPERVRQRKRNPPKLPRLIAVEPIQRWQDRPRFQQPRRLLSSPPWLPEGTDEERLAHALWMGDYLAFGMDKADRRHAERLALKSQAVTVA